MRILGKILKALAALLLFVVALAAFLLWWTHPKRPVNGSFVREAGAGTFKFTDIPRGRALGGDEKEVSVPRWSVAGHHQQARDVDHSENEDQDQQEGGEQPCPPSLRGVQGRNGRIEHGPQHPRERLRCLLRSLRVAHDPAILRRSPRGRTGLTGPVGGHEIRPGDAPCRVSGTAAAGSIDAGS